MAAPTAIPRLLGADDRQRLEARVLGACIADPRRLLAVVSVLGTTGEHFLRAGYAPAYRACVHLGSAVGLAALLAELTPGERRLLDETTPAAHLSKLEDYGMAMSAESARYMAQRLRTAHASGAALAACSAVVQALEAGDGAEEALGQLVQHLDDVRAGDDRITPTSLAELWDNPPERPTPILAGGIFSVGDWMLLHAREGVGKTWAIFELALALATGRPWYTIGTSQRFRVAIVSLEMGRWHTLERLRAIWAETVHVDDPAEQQAIRESIHLVCKDDLGFVDLADEGAQRMVHGWLREREIDVAIFDPLSHFLRGDEDRAGLAPILRFLEGLHAACGASAVLSHHDRKASTQGDVGDHGSAARGSVTIMGSARCSFRLVPKRPEEGAPVVLVCDKASNGPKPSDVWLRHDESSGRLVPTDAPVARVDKTQTAILGFIDRHPARQATAFEISEAVDGTRRTVERHLRRMEEAGMIVSHTVRDPLSRIRTNYWKRSDMTNDTSDTSDKTPLSLVNGTPTDSERHERQRATNRPVARESESDLPF